MELFTSDEAVMTFVPVAVYWLHSGLYEVYAAALEKYRLHPMKEDARNRVSKLDVVRGVLLQQALQTAISLFLFKLTGEGIKPAEEPGTCSLVSTTRQFFVTAVVMDPWQYLMHHQMHRSLFLYKHVHSRHHRLVVTYAFGAQYNHRVDGLLIETASGTAAFLVSGMWRGRRRLSSPSAPSRELTTTGLPPPLELLHPLPQQRRLP
ncbi:unnamed protein product [Spirodela intermedia]|uniref:aldehyde oxygenase (deformylating) n=1 Tax=Spirodela intermedia TaxID=51605 RepID=A0A7I8IPP9_SPIIN|nr:unnamed protein product [Spirodela intermedia]CAA6659770.1 unnamed protein product [Spirodela intermedia]